MLLAHCAAAQDASAPVVLKDILLSEDQGHAQIELVLTASVDASTSVASHPERLIIDLPNTIDGTNVSKLKVNSGGVQTIEVLHSFTDAEHTKIVIELDRSLTYDVHTSDTHINLTFRPGSGTGSDGAPAAAKRGTLTGIFHREKNASVTQSETAQNTAAAATGGVVAGHQLSQPPSSGAADRVKSPPATGSIQGVETQHSSPSSTEPLTPPTQVIASSAAQHQAPDAASQPGAFPSAVVQQVPVAATATSALANAAQQPATTTTSRTPAGAASATQTESPAQGQQKPVTREAVQTAAVTPSETSESAEAPATSTATASEPGLAIRAADPSLRTVFRVKYVAEGVAYLDGGRSAGLKEGVKLEIREADLPARDGAAVVPSDPRVIAELEVSGLAENSAVTDIHGPKRPVKPGDLAYLSSADAEALVQANALSPTRSYPAVISFTEDDPEDEEVRDQVPRPPLPSVNRARGQIGFDYMDTASHGSNTVNSSAIGMMFRGDITRIGGTYWNLSGYWRGRFTRESPQNAQTLQDLINRTYHLSMTYDNPNSAWVAGFGRLYLPWANSLDTIDGGYFGRKLAGGAILGVFGGSTPDPTSYDYAPDRSIGGTFLNFTGGDYNKLHYSSTFGGGVSLLNWQIDRPFGFFENTISYTQHVSLYDALQVDSPSGNAAVAAPGLGLSRNFLTFRVQPDTRIELDFNHTYFRDIPTFDPALIGTGLLDKYLFQGFSAGARVQVVKNVSLYAQLGRSSRSGDASSSLNQLYGITFTRLPLWNLRADFHYAEFNSSFGTGKYKAFSVSRSLTDSLETEVTGGQQSFSSLMTAANNSWFVIGNLQTNFGAHYFIQGSYTVNRGQMSYEQSMITLGYRFDTKARHKE